MESIRFSAQPSLVVCTADGTLVDGSRIGLLQHVTLLPLLLLRRQGVIAVRVIVHTCH